MDKIYRYGFRLVLLDLGFVWLRSSFGKITGGKFVETLGPTLTKFASNNPNTWYKDLLHNVMIPNSQFLGNLIMWGEFATAILITLPSLYLLFNKSTVMEKFLLIGLLGGLVLNLNFWFASGWTSSSTESLNLLMLTVELIGLVIYAKALFRR